MTVGVRIPIPRDFVLTAAANTLAGAELYVYQNLTTTPLTLYSDRACTTPAANPIVSAAGFFPRRYVASAQLMTLTLKTTAGSTIHSDDYVAGYAESGNEVYDIALTTAGGTTAYTLTTGLSLGSYASGLAFLIKMNATNTGASTLNVDGLGAKDLTKNGSTALSAGDLTSGTVYRVAYDGTRFQVVGVIPDATDATLTALAALQTTTVAPLINGLLFGCTLSNNGSDATNDIDIAAGTCADYTGAQVVTVAALTKQLDANWAAGTNQGMRYSGAAITNTTYHIYVAWKADGTQDIYADPSAVYATVLSHLQAETGGSGYLYLRRIGSIVRTGGAIKGFTQLGDEFLWKAAAADISANPASSSAVSRTMTVPTGIQVVGIFNVMARGDAAASADGRAYISSLDQDDEAAANRVNVGMSSNVVQAGDGSVQLRVRTNTSGQVRSRMVDNDAGVLLIMTTVGYVDTRGRLSA